VTGAGAAELDECVDGAGRALEDRQHRAVGLVGDGARDAARLGLAPDRVAEEDPLHAPMGADAAADGGAGHRGYGRAMTGLAAELDAAGGAAAPPAATARLRELLGAALTHGRDELGRSRSGYGDPVEVAFAADGDRLLAATPADAALRADPQAAGERAWLLVAATVAALVELAEPGAPARAEDLAIAAGELPGGHLVLAYPAPGVDAGALEELAPLAFDEHAGTIDRLRACAFAVPARLLGEVDARPPIGAGHPLRIAEAIARLGGSPASPADVEAHDEAVLALLERDGPTHPTRPHEDPIPANRVARRILQRLDGMGKWGGYHTDFAHLPRGFAGNDRALASEVGEALLDAGLLAEKPSVGQRHVFLNPRRAADIHRYVDDGTPPPGMRLPRE
jgi:hypothetical protein